MALTPKLTEKGKKARKLETVQRVEVSQERRELPEKHTTRTPRLTEYGKTVRAQQQERQARARAVDMLLDRQLENVLEGGLQAPLASRPVPAGKSGSFGGKSSGEVRTGFQGERLPGDYDPMKAAGATLKQGLAQFAQTGSGLLAGIEDVAFMPFELMAGQKIGEASQGGLMNRWHDSIVGYEQAVREDNRKNLEAGGKAAQILDDVGTAAVAAVPQAVAAMLTGGASVAAQSTAGLNMAAQSAMSPGVVNTVNQAVRRMARDPRYWMSFAQTIGPSYQQAVEELREKNSGELTAMDMTKATLYALGNGLAGAAVEVGGGIQTLPEELRHGGSAWRALVDTAVDEGKEEAVQGILERGLQGIYGKDNPLFSMTDPEAVLNPVTAGKEAALGGAVGLLLGGGQTMAKKGVEAMAGGRRTDVSPAGEIDQEGRETVSGKVESADNRSIHHSLKQTANGRTYVDIDVDQELFDGLSTAEMQDLAKKVIKTRFKGKVIGAEYTAYVDKTGAEHFAYPASRRMDEGIKRDKMRAAPELDNIMAASSYRDNVPPDNGKHKEATGGLDKLDVMYRVGPRVYDAEITVKVTDRGRVFYDMTKIKDVTSREIGQIPGLGTAETTGDILAPTVTQAGGEVNRAEASELDRAVETARERALQSAYEAGKSNVPREKVELLDEAQERAYTAGRQAAILVEAGPGVIRDDYTATLDRKTVEELDTVAKVLGVKVQFVDSVAGGQANAQIKDGAILMERGNPNPVRFLFGHEITHHLQEIAPAEYRRLREAAVAAMGDIENAAFARQAEYAEHDVDLSYGEAVDELTADYVGRMMEDSGYLEEFIQSHRQDRTLLEKLRDAFRELGRKLSGRYRTLAGQVEKRLTAAMEAGVKATMSLHGESSDGTMDAARYSLKDLTEEEHGALLRYKSSESYKVNAKLRDGIALTEEERTMVDELDRALEKLPSVEGVVYRTLSFDDMLDPQREYKEFIERHKAGLPVAYKAYTSASTKTDGYPLPDKAKYGVTLEIKSRHARDLAGFGNNFESEALFPRRSVFDITRVTTDESGHTRIYMEEVQTNGGDKHQGHDPQERSVAVRDLQKAYSTHADLQRVPGADTRGSHLRGGNLQEEGEKVKFSLKSPVEETADLVALHNKDEASILAALKLGGLPMPSIAVVKAEQGHSKYGPISLVFDKSAIDPQADSRNKVYGGDAYTPTAPPVEYPVDYSRMRAAEQEIGDLAQKVAGGIFSRSSVIQSMGIEEESSMDINELAKKLAGNETVQAAFLADHGENIEPVMKAKEFDSYGNDALKSYLNAEGEQEVARLAAKLLTGERLTSVELETARDCIMENWVEKHDSLLNRKPALRETRIAKQRDKLNDARVEDFIRHAWEMYEDGGKTKGDIDRWGTAEQMTNLLSDLSDGGSFDDIDRMVTDWVKGKLDGVLGDPGIYNGKERFTSKGDRRSFSALHYPYTLENIVKAMRDTQPERGGQVWGVSAGALQATSVPVYKDIQSIKQDSARLGTAEGDVYTAKLKAVDAAIEDIISKVKRTNEPHSSNSYEESDIIGSVLMDAALTRKTIDAIVKTFAREGYRISTQTAKDIQAVYKAAAALPTEYFEAKPQRAVGFDEVLAAVVPDNSGDELRRGLEQAGVQMLEYRAGDEADRLAKVNSVESAKFSLKLSGAVAQETERIIREGRKNKLSDSEIQEQIQSAVHTIYQGMVRDYGAMKPGEQPFREAQVPRRTEKGKKVSQTVRTILEARATPEEALPDIEKLTADGVFSYSPYSDKQAVADAEAEIGKHGWNKSVRTWFDQVRRGEVSKALTTQGWVLYNNAASRGDVELAMDILDAMVKHQRSAAQAVQATRILKKLSPETQLYGVQRSVDGLQEDLKARYGKKAPTLEIDRKLAEEYLQAKTQGERDAILADIYRDIGRQMPSKFLDKWNAWRYLAMLGNPRTHVRNIVGNLGFVPVVSAKNMTATAIEAMVGRISGGGLQRTKAIPGGKLLKAAWEDFANVKDMVMEGGKYDDRAAANQHIREGQRVFKNRALEAARRGNSAALEVEDMIFSKGHYAAALASYCKANGITAEQIAAGKGLDKAREYAAREAQKATYRDANAFSQFVSGVGRLGSKDSPYARGAAKLVEGVLPFRKTPANILVRGLEYSPLGLLNGIKEAMVDVRTGRKTGAEAIDSISAGMVGTGLLGLGIYLASQGWVRGSGAGDDKEKEQDKLMGHQDYALELPDGKSVTLDWLAPEALPFFMGVNLWEATQGDFANAKLVDYLGAVSQVTEPLLEMSMLQSLNDMFSQVGNTLNAGVKGLPAAISSAATSYLTQGLPTLLGQMERSGEGVRMTTYVGKNDFLTDDIQRALGKASARIPGWDFHQIPYIDAWGRQESTGDLMKRTTGNFLNPAYLSDIQESDMERELLRLYRSTGESVFPRRVDKVLRYDNQEKYLTAEEYVKYATKTGQTAREVMERLVDSPAYQKMEDGKRAEAVIKVYQYADAVGKESVSSYKAKGTTAKIIEANKKLQIKPEHYITLYLEVKDVSSLKDKNGESIPNSPGLLIMDILFKDKTLTAKQREGLYEMFDVGKTIRHYSPALVKNKLAEMRRKAG